MIDLPTRRRIAESLLGSPLDDDGFAPCPGEGLHTRKTGRRDFQVLLDGAPTARCFHASCAAAVDAYNRRLRSAIGKAEAAAARDGAPSPPMMGVGIPPAPAPPPRAKRPPFDPEMLRDFARRAPAGAARPEWWRQRSPWPVPPAAEQGPETAAAVLASLYPQGERVLVFTREFSQGDFLFEAGRGSYRLADKPGVAAVVSPLPAGGPVGVWFLGNPVTGRWLANANNRGADGAPRLGRRHAACVTAWRHAILESDEAPAGAWLRALALLPLPLCAITSSGGRSVHALVRFGCGSKAEWDSLRNALLPTVCPLGADPAALTAVRLTRLPGCLRHGTRGRDGRVTRYPQPRLQELIWWNPPAPACPVLDYVPV